MCRILYGIPNDRAGDMLLCFGSSLNECRRTILAMALVVYIASFSSPSPLPLPHPHPAPSVSWDFSPLQTLCRDSLSALKRSNVRLLRDPVIMLTGSIGEANKQGRLWSDLNDSNWRGAERGRVVASRGRCGRSVGVETHRH